MELQLYKSVIFVAINYYFNFYAYVLENISMILDFRAILIK